MFCCLFGRLYFEMVNTREDWKQVNVEARVLLGFVDRCCKLVTVLFVVFVTVLGDFLTGSSHCCG